MRTLIIFDTNKLRSTQSGGVSYGSFEFSSDFNDLKKDIKEKGLSEFIDIAIPSVTIQELVQQKYERYSKDKILIDEIRSRLSELPGANFSQISLPASDFDYKEHLNPKIVEFIHNNDLTIIEITEEKLGHVLKEVLKRAIERRSPFKGGADMGFKDVMIWESVLNYGGYDRYDKVILFTGDSGFNEKCIEEFESKVHKKLVITPLMADLQAEIEEDYAHLIESKEWRDFVATDYFQSYFSGELSNLDYVTVDGVEYKVSRVTVINYLDRVEKPEDSEETGIATVLVSSLKGSVEINGSPKEVGIKARTLLDDAKDIQYTEFVVE